MNKQSNNPVKTSNHNTKSKISSKSVSEWDEYLNTISLQMEPATNGFFKRLAFQLVTWAREDKDAFIITQFLNMKGIQEKTFYRWVEKHPIVAEANESALALIADRREMVLCKNDPSSLKYMMPQYSKKWLKEDERRAKQKQELAQKMNEVPVPPKPEDVQF